MTFNRFDNWSNEFFQEASDFEQTGPKMVNEIDYQTFNVGAIVILVCHYHYWAVPEITDISVNFAHVKTHDFNQVLKLLVLQDLASGCISNIHWFTL